MAKSDKIERGDIVRLKWGGQGIVVKTPYENCPVLVASDHDVHPCDPWDIELIAKATYKNIKTHG